MAPMQSNPGPKPTAVATPLTLVVVTATSVYTAEDRGRWKTALLAKGQEIAKRLEEVLAGKDARLDDFSLFARGEPAEPPERRLRRYLDLVMKRMRAVDHPRFGFDRERDGFLPVAAIDEMPWVDVEPL